MNDLKKEVQMNERKVLPLEQDELGISNLPLCREPWESYYILRRGIMPCCHGVLPIAPMSEWPTAWNSPQLQEIRRYLSQGELSPYCKKSLSCPIVQKYMAEQRPESIPTPLSPGQKHALLRLLNKLFFRLPGKIYRALRYKQQRN